MPKRDKSKQLAEFLLKGFNNILIIEWTGDIVRVNIGRQIIDCQEIIFVLEKTKKIFVKKLEVSKCQKK